MPNHYQIEVVADVPVWLGGVCRAGRLIDWFGRHDKRGLYAQLWVQPWVQKPGVDAFEVVEVVGRRRVVSVRVVGG